VDEIKRPENTRNRTIEQVEVTVFVGADDPAPIAEHLEEFGVRVTEKDVFGTEAIDSNCHLVIAVDRLGDDVLVRNAVNSLKDGGFLLFVESEKPTEQRLNTTGLELVAKLKSRDDKTFVLLRKVRNNVRNVRDKIE